MSALVRARARRRGRLAAPATLLLLLVAGCGPFGSSATPPGTIVVPPPATPGAEPTPLTLTQPNTHHVHAIATRGGSDRVLVATHLGLVVALRGQAQAPDGPYIFKGDVLQVLYTPDGTAIAAGHNIGIQVSRDDGKTWSPAAAEVAGLDVHGLAFDPTGSGTLFAYAVKKGILASTDGGVTWSHRPGFADQNYLTGLTVTGDGTLLAGSPELGIAASTDHGSNFVSVRQGTGQVFSLAAARNSADVVVAGTENGIFLTVDGGKNWNVGATNVAVTGMGVDPTDAQRLFAGGADGSLSVSLDAGSTWAPL